MVNDRLNIYLASSWRNPRYPAALAKLQDAGFDVYDFRNEGASFHWGMIDPGWRLRWKASDVRKALEHPLAQRAFEADKKAIDECDALVMLMPCGASAHSEFGYAAGIGKRTVIVLAYEVTEAEGRAFGSHKIVYLVDNDGRHSAEVMYRLAGDVCISVAEAVDAIREWERRKP